MDALGTTLMVLDYAAVAVFGASGALAAARAKHDIITFGFFAAITGVGGGTLRDLLIDAPVFWVARPEYVAVCLAAAVGVWIFGWGQGREKTLLWLDAVGMAAYAVVGALKATSLGVPPLSAVVMGVLTRALRDPRLAGGGSVRGDGRVRRPHGRGRHHGVHLGLHRAGGRDPVRLAAAGVSRTGRMTSPLVIPVSPQAKTGTP
jgi:hypothetical protein